MIDEQIRLLIIMKGEEMRVIFEIEEELMGGMVVAMRIVISEEIMSVKYWNQ